MFLAGDFTDEQSLSVHSALGTNDHLRTLDTGQHNNNARSHEFYQVGVKEDGLYHCPYEGSTSTFCKHKPTILKCHYDKYVDAHLKPFRCEESHCDNLSFSSPACLNRHKRETHGRYIQCPAPGCNRKKENGFKRSLNLLDHINRVHIEGSRKDRHPPRKDRHPPRKDRHVPKKDRLRCPYSGCESNDFKSKKTLSAHIWKFHSTMDEDNFLKLPCPYSNCSCSSPGRGFLRCDNLSDHLRRIHNSPIW
ncbi:hypothetical protein B0J14DRAFT_547889 [Halenospora varia]|nr:hypothetical protein B0J14DRAFT_547889 [Halenospora varia]